IAGNDSEGGGYGGWGKLVEPQGKVGTPLDSTPLRLAIRLTPDRRPRRRRAAQPAEIDLQSLERIAHAAPGVVLPHLGDQRHARPERRRTGRQPRRSAAQNERTIAATFLRHIANHEPVEGA